MNVGYGRFLRSFGANAKKRVYLVSGDDQFLKREATLALLRDWRKGVIDLEEKDATNLPFHLMEDLMGEPSLVMDFRVLVFSNFDKVKNFKDGLKAFLKGLADIDERVKVIFVLSPDESRLEKEEENFFECNLVCDSISGDSKEFPQYVDLVLASFKKKVSPEGMDYLRVHFQDRFSQLSTELTKAVLYVGEREILELSDLKEVLFDYPTNEVFELIRHIFRRDKRRALSIMEDLLTRGVGSALILHLMTQRVQVLFGVMEARRRGESTKDFMLRKKIPLFQFDDIVDSLKVINFPTLRQGVRCLVEAEKRAKQHSESEELLLLRLVDGFASAA